MSTTEPLRVDDNRLDKILGRTRRSRTAPSPGYRVLIWHDGWRKRDRVLRWQGPCLCCERQTWAFDDGENDPRGMLGDAALWAVDLEDSDGNEREARACAICANEYESYQWVQKVALRIGWEKSAPLEWGKK